MPEIGRFRRSWLLLKTSLTVLLQNRKLLLFPLVSVLFTIVTVLFFTAPAILMPTGHSVFSGDHWIAVGQRSFEVGPSVNGHPPAPKPWLIAGQTWIGIVAGALWLLSMITLSFLSGVADQIYRSALYIYASEGVAPWPYSAEMMDMAWKIKGKM
jgi:hypothetical protein